MNERVRRVAVNEAVFRELNAQLVGLAPGDDAISCVCECGDIACVEKLVLSRAEYRRVREDPTTFAIRRGHEKPDVEDVVASYDDYEVVRKKPGLAAELARETAR
jgi:hypothetical protein